jgi:short subunit dehydrogenase-like uncharacterized protein
VAKILIWGATGFTGSLVACELAAQMSSDDELILGGRNLKKLEAIAESFEQPCSLRQAQADDETSLHTMLEGIDVVVSTVGPYRRYGFPLAKACAETGVDYLDLCGETPFIRRCIDELGDSAAASGARLVHACGFDSIPSDLGLLALHQELENAGLPRLGHAQTTLCRLKGGLSGGTFASMLGLIKDAVNDKQLRRILGHPYSLNPADERKGPQGRDRSGASFDSDHQRWTAPFLMAGINTRVVRRSNALLGHPYGTHLLYDEAMACRSRLQALSMSAGLHAFTLGAALPPSRWLLEKLLPKPGQGPDEDERAAGYFELQIVARQSADTPEIGRLIVAAQGDPGYSQTAVMLSQSALLLAAGESSAHGGIHTPASALGMKAVERLRAQGFRFEFRGAA